MKFSEYLTCPHCDIGDVVVRKIKTRLIYDPSDDWGKRTVVCYCTDCHYKWEMTEL